MLAFDREPARTTGGRLSGADGDHAFAVGVLDAHVVAVAAITGAEAVDGAALRGDDFCRAAGDYGPQIDALMQAGANAFLRKPFSIDELCKKIGELLEMEGVASPEPPA